MKCGGDRRNVFAMLANLSLDGTHMQAMAGGDLVVGLALTPLPDDGPLDDIGPFRQKRCLSTLSPVDDGAQVHAAFSSRRLHADLSGSLDRLGFELIGVALLSQWFDADSLAPVIEADISDAQFLRSRLHADLLCPADRLLSEFVAVFHAPTLLEIA